MLLVATTALAAAAGARFGVAATVPVAMHHLPSRQLQASAAQNVEASAATAAQAGQSLPKGSAERAPHSRGADENSQDDWTVYWGPARQRWASPWCSYGHHHHHHSPFRRMEAIVDSLFARSSPLGDTKDGLPRPIFELLERHGVADPGRLKQELKQEMEQLWRQHAATARRPWGFGRWGRQHGPPAEDARPEGGKHGGRETPLVVEQDDKALYVQAELPGFSKADVKVQLDPTDNALTIHAARHSVEQLGGGNGDTASGPAATEGLPTNSGSPQLTRRQRWSSWSQRLVLPEDADHDAITATTKDGLLTVTVPRKVQPPPEPVPKTREIPLQ